MHRERLLWERFPYPSLIPRCSSGKINPKDFEKVFQFISDAMSLGLKKYKKDITKLAGESDVKGVKKLILNMQVRRGLSFYSSFSF